MDVASFYLCPATCRRGYYSYCRSSVRTVPAPKSFSFAGASVVGLSFGVINSVAVDSIDFLLFNKPFSNLGSCLVVQLETAVGCLVFFFLSSTIVAVTVAGF